MRCERWSLVQGMSIAALKKREEERKERDCSCFPYPERIVSKNNEKNYYPRNN